MVWSVMGSIIIGMIHLFFFQLLPEDIHIRANGRLFVSVTSVYSGENIIISNYSSKKELVDVSENLNLMLLLHVYS